MVYHISNRVLYRGFHSCPGSRKKIIRQDGMTVKGEWLTGQLVEIPMETPPGARPQMPILCLGTPGRRLGSVSARSVYPDTLSQFSWTYVDTKWELLVRLYFRIIRVSRALSSPEGFFRGTRIRTRSAARARPRIRSGAVHGAATGPCRPFRPRASSSWRFPCPRPSRTGISRVPFRARFPSGTRQPARARSAIWQGRSGKA